MQMKKCLAALAITAVAVSGLPVAGVSSALARSTVNISAGVNSSCDPRETAFVVPGGQTATEFAADFRSGQNCGSGTVPESSGYLISRGQCGISELPRGDVYRYWRTKTNSGSSSPLANLRIAPGTYCLSFDGGRGGYVQLNYALVP
jgi:hypothetical protein